MIEVTNLNKVYGKHTAVNDLSFTVKEGQILGFLGPNGAGKSTTMNMLTGYLSSTSGTIKINGIDILENPIKAKKNIGYLPEIPPLYLDMTVSEYLYFVAKLKKVNIKALDEHIQKIITRLSLDNVAGRLIKHLSKGYRQRVGLGGALIGSPKVLILDEPTVGLDPKQIIEMRELIIELSKEHTIILSSHILSEISAICDHVMIINKGTIVASDTTENLANLFNPTSQITIRVEKVDDDFLSALSSIEEVNQIQDLGIIEEGTHDILIETSKDVDIRKQVFNLCYEMYNPLLMMHSKAVSLEDIFLEVTKNEPVTPLEEEQPSSFKKFGKKNKHPLGITTNQEEGIHNDNIAQ